MTALLSAAPSDLYAASGVPVRAATTLRAQTPTLLLCYGVLLCARMPQILIKGRFWAEEGRIFFSAAWHLPWWRAALLPYGGYLNLVANLAALLARGVPLEFAPYVTIAIGLLFQLLPPVLLLTAPDPWLRPLWVRICGLCLLLFMPGSEEVWLQTLHCQFQLVICCGIILALAPGQGGAEVFHRCLLVLAPLAGPVAIALCPLFALRAATERSRARTLQAAAILAGAAVQLRFFFAPGPGRAYGIDPGLAMAVVAVKHVLVPFLGEAAARGLALGWRTSLAVGHLPTAAVVLPTLLLGCLLAAVAMRGLAHPAPWLFGCFAATASISYYGAIAGGPMLLDPLSGQRYAVAPQLLLELSILSLAATSGAVRAMVPRAAVAWLILIGAAHYRHVSAYSANGPSWRHEVALWRRNPDHALLIWPYGWTMALNPYIRRSELID